MGPGKGIPFLNFFLILSFMLTVAWAQDGIELTEKEKAWLKAHPVITFTGDPDWLPYENFNEQGVYGGIVADHLKLIEQKLGIKLKKVVTSSWVESVDKAVAGEVDILSETTETKLHSHLNFTQTYISNPIVVIMRNEEKYVESIDYLRGKKIAQIKEYGYTKQIYDAYPDIKFHVVNDVEEGLMAVSEGKVDALICALAQGTYNIQKLGIYNVKIAGSTRYKMSMAFGMQKEHTELISVFNKAIAQITPAEQSGILAKWANLNYIEKTDYTLFYQLFGIFALILAGSLYWNRKLRREIDLRAKTEAGLKVAKEKSEAANRAKSLFLANMSHEIRTPMNAILGFSELLGQMPQSNAAADYIQKIKTSGNSLLQLINDILDLSKVEAGKLGLEYTPTSLKGIFDEMELIFSQKVVDAGLDFEMTLPPDLPDLLLIDETRIRQVLVNFISNAVKFTESGFVKVYASFTYLNESENSVRLKITIADSGIGIPPAEQKKVFGMFEQSEGQKNAKYGGTGLGLTICQNLIDMMGGELSMTSAVDQGSSFSLELPHVEVPSEAPQKAKQLDITNLSFEPAKILIADDIDFNRELLRGFLKNCPFEIIEAKNGQEVLAQISNNSPDLVLLDMKMPILDGYEVMEKLQQTKPVKETPIIAVTASALKKDETLISKICHGYLRKPINQRALMESLCSYLPHKLIDTEAIKEITKKPELSLSVEKTAELHSLLEDLSPMHKAISQTLLFGEAQEFANKIGDLSESFPLQKVEDYSASLQTAVTTYDTSALKEVLESFADLLASLSEKSRVEKAS